MANARDNRPLTEKQWNEMKTYLDKEEGTLTERQVSILKKLVLKQTNYNPKTLGSGVKSDLIKMYTWFVYNKGSIKDSNYESIAIEKGTTQEGESLRLLSQYDGVNYKKNERKYRNRYIVGIPDIVISRKGVKKVIDIKTPIDINSFMMYNEIDLPKEYIHQMYGYLELTKAAYGEVVFCLVNLPPELINQEVKKLKSKLFLYGISDENIQIRVENLQRSMVFGDMPINTKIIKFVVHPNPEFMKQVYQRVKLARLWMKDFHKKSNDKREINTEYNWTDMGESN